MSNKNNQEVQRDLLEIKEKFDYLINKLIKDRSNKEHIKIEYTLLKNKLKKDSNTFRTVKGQSEASEAETAYYYPAVTEAYTELEVKINSQPSDKMLQCLISAEDYISYYISQEDT